MIAVLPTALEDKEQKLRSGGSEDEIPEVRQAARRTKAFGRGRGEMRQGGCGTPPQPVGKAVPPEQPHYKTSVQHHLVQAFGEPGGARRALLVTGDGMVRLRRGRLPPRSQRRNHEGGA
jgi:hypothetical protein